MIGQVKIGVTCAMYGVSSLKISDISVKIIFLLIISSLD